MKDFDDGFQIPPKLPEKCNSTDLKKAIYQALRNAEKEDKFQVDAVYEVLQSRIAELERRLEAYRQYNERNGMATF